MSNIVAASDRIVAAYNSKDFALMRRLIAPTIDMAHYNRGFKVNRVEDLLAAMEGFAASFMKNRKFEAPERVQTIDDLVIRESYWGGTPDVDIPGFGVAGQPLRLKLCSLMRFDRNEILIEWTDYG